MIHSPSKNRIAPSVQEFFIFLFLCSGSVVAFAGQSAGDSLIYPNEKHFASVKQLTFGEINAEAYFSFDEKKIIFMSTRDSLKCDQIFTMDVDGQNVKMVSTGKGMTTCAYFYPDGKHILYSSTHLAGLECPARPDKSKGYVWGVYKSYDIFMANSDGSDLKRLTDTDGYDAEAVISPVADKIVFCSARDGDLELYTMNLDGSDQKRLTFDVGYDGGPWYSWDGKKIVYRAHHPTDSTEIKEYKALLANGLVKPEKVDIFVMDSDGKNIQQLTDNNKANFGPFFFPDDKRIIFSSNMNDPKGRNFNLFMINVDGTGLEQITFTAGYNFFPMFTRDGKKLIFISSRNAKSRYEFNVFIADWVD
jgi:Tol biopolymer transport system component